MTSLSETELDELERSVNSIVDICHKMNAEWWICPKTGADLRENPLIVPVKLLMMVTEVAEATEGDRSDKMDDKLTHLPAIDVELADLIIRIGDLAGAKKYQLARAVREKTMFNLSRPDHKHENRKKAGGKKY
jgi:NTP pyrophosphatase (non-canonical NTP hydrolase)